MLTCPKCRRLVHSDRLKVLADTATQAPSPVDALVAWREALELLPPGTRQYDTIQAKITELGKVVDTLPSPPPTPSAEKQNGAAVGRVAGLGAIGLILWKFKVFLLLALTKGKVLLLGLTKASTFTSMMLSFGVYWTMFGWPLALLMIGGVFTALTGKAPKSGDRPGLIAYLVLALVLTMMLEHLTPMPPA